MNPKTPQDLDPKLKEAYDRVMGANVDNGSAPAQGPQVVPPPQPMTPPTASAPVNQAPPFSPTAETPPINVSASPYTVPDLQPAQPAKKKSKISPAIFLVVGLAFFAVYAVVWAKIFGLF
ncbi:MAG: hypothetical protein M1277_01460 [Patescibacteria group bacterium]|nr:hypothetical protein [Patescibacteria group bacterium]